MREFKALVHEENDGYWAEVDGLPGCFASGSDLDELREAVVEAITLYLSGDEPEELEARPASSGRVAEMTVLVAA
jgi:predicted RNase H-like HicB family nuclease